MCDQSVNHISLTKDSPRCYGESPTVQDAISYHAGPVVTLGCTYDSLLPTFTQAAMFGCGCWADQRPGVPSNAVACSTSGESHVTLIFLFEFHILCTHFRYR